MLLFGSRAIHLQIPEFRAPLDWDVVGTEADAERLLAALPRFQGKRATRNKIVFLYEGSPLELVISRPGDYWCEVIEAFKNERTLDVPVLGSVLLAPVSYCLITKQISLIYRIHHWHKNLEDIYFLRNHVELIPPHVEALFPATQGHSRNYFKALHERIEPVPVACHPSLRKRPEPKLHLQLHERFRFDERPLVEQPGAWQAFPQLSGQERLQRMRQLIAEEVMVFAAHCRKDELGLGKERSDAELKRFALREFIVSQMPEDWRYFAVNHYREIADLIPENWGRLCADLL